jgi:hypothetical protein
MKAKTFKSLKRRNWQRTNWVKLLTDNGWVKTYVGQAKTYVGRVKTHAGRVKTHAG